MVREFRGGRQGVSRTKADKSKLLRLAKEYGNVARACKEMRFVRSSYYRIRALHKRLGEAGLEPKSRRERPLLKNRVAPEIEEAVLKLTRKHRGWGQARVAAELRGRGMSISPTGVRGVWLRNNLITREALPQPVCPTCRRPLPSAPSFRCPHCRVYVPPGTWTRTIRRSLSD